MNIPYDEFKTIMEENTDGHEVEIHYGEGLNNKYPAIRLFEYSDYPQKGMLSILTYGVSNANHEHWKFEKPEFMLTIKPSDIFWSGFFGMVTDLRRGQSDFKEGYYCFAIGPVGEVSNMLGLCFGGPVSMPVNPLSLSDRRVIIREAFPIYIGEVVIINDIGVHEFIKKVGEENLSDIMRPDLSLGGGIPKQIYDQIDFLTVDEVGLTPEELEMKMAQDKIVEILNRFYNEEINIKTLQLECLRLSKFEKKILEEVTLQYYNSHGPEFPITKVFIQMYNFANGI